MTDHLTVKESTAIYWLIELLMMAAIFEVLKVLQNALAAFDFTGKPIWRLGEGLDHVKEELTFKLWPPEVQLTDQQVRAVYKPAAKKKRKQPQLQREMPHVRPRETPPPSMETQPAPPVLTFHFARRHLVFYLKH